MQSRLCAALLGWVLSCQSGAALDDRAESGAGGAPTSMQPTNASAAAGGNRSAGVADMHTSAPPMGTGGAAPIDVELTGGGGTMPAVVGGGAEVQDSAGGEGGRRSGLAGAGGTRGGEQPAVASAGAGGDGSQHAAGGAVSSAGASGGGGPGSAGWGGAPTPSCTPAGTAQIAGARCTCAGVDAWSCNEYVTSCEDSTNGTALDFEERADLAPTSPCYMGTTLPRPIRSEAEYRDIVESVDCFGQPESGVDFGSRMLFLVVVAQRSEIDVSYATLSNGVVSVGVEAQAYCGGSYPQDGVEFLELDAVDAVFAQRQCNVGKCTQLAP